MLLADKLRTLRETEGQLRGFGRAITQGELVKAIRVETGKTLSQSYLSQIESGARPHLTNTTRLLLAEFFKVHPGFLVDDPEGYHAELLSDLRAEATLDAKLDAWLVGGAERFRRDPELHNALLTLAMHPDSRACLLLLETVIDTPGLASRLADLLRPNLQRLQVEEVPAALSRGTEGRQGPVSLLADEAHATETPSTSARETSAVAVSRSSAYFKPKSFKTARRPSLPKLPGAPHAR